MAMRGAVTLKATISDSIIRNAIGMGAEMCANRILIWKSWNNKDSEGGSWRIVITIAASICFPSQNNDLIE